MNQKKYSEKSYSIFQIQRIPRAICRGPGMFRLSNRPPCVCAGPVWRAVTDQWTSTPLVTRKVIILWRVWKICLVSAFSLPPPKKSPLRDSDNYLTVYWSSIFDIVSMKLYLYLCLWKFVCDLSTFYCIKNTDDLVSLHLYVSTYNPIENARMQYIINYKRIIHPSYFESDE